MLKKICGTCYSYIKCNYCVTYGKIIGQEMNANAHFCKTCSAYELCMFCNKYGKEKGKYYHDQYIDYIKKCNIK